MTAEPAETKTASRTAGSQTLARGLEVLRAVTAARDGLSVAEVAERIGIHRTIAYRALNTLADAHMVHRGEDGRYRGSTGLLSLASAAHQSLRAAALPVLTDAAERLGATVALIVREGSDAVALAVVSPTGGTYHVGLSEGSRHPLGRGAAGHAIMVSAPALPGEPESVANARRDGYAQTFGEVEPNMYGLAVPIPEKDAGVPACLNIITVRQDVAASAVKPLQEAAARISRRLA
ncbi:transcriptional regulator [Zafaria cholistanensis]|uniref:Transcriptional regulator n=1 Tax=Zafaria cholistanensis TaxID=1682741 RepID=A0A5A7NPP2_9MICC|nr:helix-turn-helix domain-containing protein [Zafaria cholistanensis]GER22735.1 transcriptional regulator [Zafaria cholistanensis]